ncbi:MAG: hypothetical protein ACK4XH_07530, partial [Microcystis sp.]|uniref:hypothetical protein n=1 Tax=Microcystis sp. TaxID=1127 RepID=UPI003918BF42
KLNITTRLASRASPDIEPNLHGFIIAPHFTTQTTVLGGSTPQTPRALVFRWDAYTRLLIHL